VIVADFIFIVVLIAFFGLGALFVKACDLIIGRDDVALAEGAAGDAERNPTEQAA
jgi:hypothetical protein